MFFVCLQRMDYKPAFRRQPLSSELTIKASPEAAAVEMVVASQSATKVKVPGRVIEEAKERILQAGGDPGCYQLVLSESELQFGKYRGQTFKWLLANDVGWVCGLLASHQRERDGGDRTQSPLMANKDALLSYAELFPEVAALIRERRMKEGSLPIRGLDATPVGFGQNATDTYRSLYESTSAEKQG